MLTAYELVKKANPDDVVVLARASNPETAARIMRFKTAGGYDTTLTPGLEPTAPTETEAMRQAAGASSQDPLKLPEYSSDQTVVESFARMSGAIVMIAIKRKFLTAGSVVEAGWVVRHEAPVEKAMLKKVEQSVKLKTSDGRFIDAG